MCVCLFRSHSESWEQLGCLLETEIELFSFGARPKALQCLERPGGTG